VVPVPIIIIWPDPKKKKRKGVVAKLGYHKKDMGLMKPEVNGLV